MNLYLENLKGSIGPQIYGKLANMRRCVSPHLPYFLRFFLQISENTQENKSRSPERFSKIHLYWIPEPSLTNVLIRVNAKDAYTSKNALPNLHIIWVPRGGHKIFVLLTVEILDQHCTMAQAPKGRVSQFFVILS